MVAVAPTTTDWLWQGDPCSLQKAVIRFGLPSTPQHEASHSAAPKQRPASCPSHTTGTEPVDPQEKLRSRAPSAEQAASSSSEPLLLSKGSSGHTQGECRPCAWRWKPSGCSNGAECLFCHVCDQGALKLRKQERQRVLKAARSKQTEGAEGSTVASATAVPACAANALLKPASADPRAACAESRSASDVRRSHWSISPNQAEDQPMKLVPPPGLPHISPCEVWLSSGFEHLEGCEHLERFQL